jgi:hypothetical protein
MPKQPQKPNSERVKVTLTLPRDLLVRIDQDRATIRTTRGQWLEQAARKALVRLVETRRDGATCRPAGSEG